MTSQRPSLSSFVRNNLLVCLSLGMLDVVDMEGLLQGDEEHVSGTIMMMLLYDGMISCLAVMALCDIYLYYLMII